jgi:hypothetical protein
MSPWCSPARGIFAIDGRRSAAPSNLHARGLQNRRAIPIAAETAGRAPLFLRQAKCGDAAVPCSAKRFASFGDHDSGRRRVDRGRGAAVPGRGEGQTRLPILSACQPATTPALPMRWRATALMLPYVRQQIAAGEFIYDGTLPAMRAMVYGLQPEAIGLGLNIADYLAWMPGAKMPREAFALPKLCTVATTEAGLPPIGDGLPPATTENCKDCHTTQQ